MTMMIPSLHDSIKPAGLVCRGVLYKPGVYTRDLTVPSKSLTFHGPVKYGCFRDYGNIVQTDPFPEDHFLRIGVGLHFALHFDIEYLQCLSS